MRRYLRQFSAIAALLACPAVVFAGFAGTDVFLPMAGRQAGAHPSNWYTTVWIHNPGTEAVTATVAFLQRNTVNLSPPTVDVLVAPGATEKIENVVESLFHLQEFGALRVTSPTGKLVVTSRVYSKALGEGETDSVGQDFAGVPAAFAIAAGERTQVLGVHQTLPTTDSDFRFNFGLVETTGHSAWVRVHAMDEAGAEQGFTDIQVREYSQRQVAFKDHFPTLSTDNMRLDVEVISGAGKVIAYGSAIANGSQDPTTFEMTYDDALLGAAAVQHDATLVGDGSAAAPLGIAEGGVGADQLPAQVVTAEKLADAAVTVHKLATVPPPAPTPEGVGALRTDPLEAFFKTGEEMFWAPAFIGDITAVNTAAGSGLTGGATEGDADIAVAPLGVTSAMLADRSITATKIDATPPSGSDPLKLKWSPTTGKMLWGPDFDSICPKGFMCGSTTMPVYRVTNEAAGIALQGDAVTGTGVRGETTSGFAGVDGRSTSTYGLYGRSEQGTAVFGLSNGVGGASYGVHGRSDQGIGVYGYSSTTVSPSAGVGVLGRNDDGIGVKGQSSTGTGVFGTSATGNAVEGINTGLAGSAANFETSEGRNMSAAVTAVSRGQGAAVAGRRESNGAEGYLARYYGAYGQSSSGHSGYLGGTYGAQGESSSTEGYLGGDSYGAYGLHDSTGNYGYLGSNTYGALGRKGDDSSVGYLGSTHGVYGRCTVGGGRYAGYFSGPVLVTSLEGTGNRDVYANSSGSLIISTSDARLKKDVLDLAAHVDVLAALVRLRGVTYTWDTAQERASGLGEQREIGMIAQEVEAVLPELVGTGADGYKSLDYAKLTAFLVEVTKAQQEQIERQRSEIGDLKRRLQGLERALAEPANR